MNEEADPMRNYFSNNEPVVDALPGERHSVFAKSIVRYLQQVDPVVVASDLHRFVLSEVSNRITQKGTNRLARHPNGNLVDGGGFPAREQAGTKLRREKRCPVSGVAPEDFLLPLLVAVLIAFSIILLAPKANASALDEYEYSEERFFEAYDCFNTAAYVEIAEEIHDPVRRNKRWREWLEMAKAVQEESLVHRARDAYSAGITSDEMYSRCPDM